MEKPIIFDTKPVVLDLEPGTYYWCKCGASKNQPYCDGSHKETGFAPQAFEIMEKSRVAICNCKHTANSPFCDGSHSKL